MMIRTANAHDVDAIGELWLQLVAYHRQIDPENMPESARGGRKARPPRGTGEVVSPRAVTYSATCHE